MLLTFSCLQLLHCLKFVKIGKETKVQEKQFAFNPGGGGGGVLLYKSYIGMSYPTG